MERETFETPVSQRVTIPSPQPFAAAAAAVAPRVPLKPVGAYLIVNERALAKRARRREPA